MYFLGYLCLPVAAGREHVVIHNRNDQRLE
jgi:hypothetical protein